MTETVIHAGVCGFITTVRAHPRSDGTVALEIAGGCSSVQTLARSLESVDPLREITYRGEGPLVLAEARRCLPHPACPVPAGILKCVEVAAGLALPRGATIEFPSDEGGK